MLNIESTFLSALIIKSAYLSALIIVNLSHKPQVSYTNDPQWYNNNGLHAPPNVTILTTTELD